MAKPERRPGPGQGAAPLFPEPKAVGNLALVRIDADPPGRMGVCLTGVLLLTEAQSEERSGHAGNLELCSACDRLSQDLSKTYPGQEGEDDMASDGMAGSNAEDLFVELFCQVFGAGSAQFLTPQVPFQDIYGQGRRIDFAVKAVGERFAFEIDGVQWHHPEAVTIEKFEDDLLRQNSLVADGWKVFRWTDHEVIEHPERVKDQLARFLEKSPRFQAFEEYLPRQRGEALELRDHQQEALASLVRLRQEGKTIALLHHATGTGKTVTAIKDAKSLGGRTLFLVHRDELMRQALRQFRALWGEEPVGSFGGKCRDPQFNTVGTVQTVSRHLATFRPDEFDYLIIDEAHHAAAGTYRKVLGYFTPRFILGLTATPCRADEQSVLEIFQECAHRLDLKTAIELGELVPIRCVRVETNVDLSKVRFNQVDYRYRELEETIRVPARNRLIVDTYRKYVPGRRGVVFCVNVEHAREVASLFRQDGGIEARAVWGRMTIQERQEILAGFCEGRFPILCACDVLTEGWDCPEVEVLMMARPTLSKVVYLQQLGRGTRKAPGKESLVVFDFIDNASRYGQSWNLHKLAGKNTYRPGGLVLAPPGRAAEEEARIGQGGRPPAVLEIDVWEKGLQVIDIFRWQEEVEGMLSVVEVEMALHTSEGTIQDAVRSGRIKADHAVPIGERTAHFFRKDRLEEIRVALALPKATAENILDRFLECVREMTMSASYKPVLMLALLDTVDDTGTAEITKMVTAFRAFYLQRAMAGLVVEDPRVRMSQVETLSDEEVTRCAFVPFRKFEVPGFLEHDRDLSRVRFARPLWQRLSQPLRQEVRNICLEAIDRYFQRINPAPR